MNNSKATSVSYFFVIAMIGLLAVLIGFARTFILPSFKGTFSAPAVVYVHGAFAFSWIILFIVQTSLIHFRKYTIHMFLGMMGIFIAIGTAFTMLPTAMYAANRDIKLGMGEVAISSIVGVATSALMFLAIVIAGIMNRKNAATHKRLMLLATLVVLWPAWFRFRHYFPSVPRPDIWFAVVLADSLIVISCIWDKITNGRVHPVLLYVGSFIILEHVFEVIFFNTPVWYQFAKHIYNFLS